MSDVKALRQTESASFFVEVLERLNGDYPRAAALFALLSRQADITFIPFSNRKLSALLGACIPFCTLFRALSSLETLGLIDSKTHRNTTTRYRVNVDALQALLAKPMPTPGATPIPNRLRQNETLAEWPLLFHFDAITHNTSSPEFLVALLNRLGQDYSLCAVLFALLAQQADLDFVQVSCRELSASTGGAVLHRTTLRALATLETIDLVERQVVSKKDVRYRVDADALHSLLARPVAPAPVIPGLTPLPALQRIFVASAPSNSLETFPKGSVHA